MVTRRSMADSVSKEPDMSRTGVAGGVMKLGEIAFPACSMYSDDGQKLARDQARERKGDKNGLHLTAPYRLDGVAS
jgi:hypothetical protein